MEPASHIMEWAHNSQPLYKRMQGLGSVNFLYEAGRAAAAVNIALASVAEMVKLKEIAHNEYTAEHILDAAKLMLGWAGPEMPRYRRGWTDYPAIRDLASDPTQCPAIVTQEEFDEMLGCVPPIYVVGVAGFLVGEALTGDERGTVYANYYISRDGVPCARYYCLEKVR